MTEDAEISSTDDAAKRTRGARLFDIRRLIGALFVLYGVILTIVGLTDGKAALHKASGVHINLWTGLGMLIFGILMLVWAFARPVIVDDADG
jgi:xanthine/uracil/vitamin C permease (AzgA family)